MSRYKDSGHSNDGDWLCSNESCGNMNFARRHECNKCGAAKVISSKKGGVEIGKALAEKSKGLFSADDWQCKTCGNVNWARRSTCNMCNAPKVGKLEERTGFGGGFMERDEIVEYKEREESDDEYDEFGRKKKKFRKREPDTIARPEHVEPDEEEEEDEDEDVSKYQLDDDDDEEDDDDDADLSKYALDSDEDVNESKTESNRRNSSEKQSRSKNRRSRSRSPRHRSRSPRSRSNRSRSRSRSRSRHDRHRRRSRSNSRGRY